MAHLVMENAYIFNKNLFSMKMIIVHLAALKIMGLMWYCVSTTFLHMGNIGY